MSRTVRDRRVQQWVIFVLGSALAAVLVVWLARQLFNGDEAASKLALAFLTGLLGYVLRGAKSV